MITLIKKYVIAALAVASACFANAQEISPNHIKEIFALAKKSAEDDFNVNFYGFFAGMSRYDAADLASYYKLKEDEYSVSAEPGKAVSKLWFSLKGVRRITRAGSTVEELAQAVANRVGDLKGSNGGWKHETIDGIVVTFNSGGLNIRKDGAASQSPLATEVAARKDKLDKEAAERAAKEAREAAERAAKEAQEIAARKQKEVISGIIQGMVAIPGKNFKMGKYEVTQKQWVAVFGGNLERNEDDHDPVRTVWPRCQEFIKKLNALPEVKTSGLTFRLPKEEEWEYACRAGGTGKYCRLADGTEITEKTLGKVAWYKHNSERGTRRDPHPVGQKMPNAFGLYDMLGNVSEWCLGTYKDKLGDPSRVSRGGDFDSSNCTADSDSRTYHKVRFEWSEWSGFRLAASQDPIVGIVEIIKNMVAIPGKDYKMGKYEVTQRQWESVMGENPSHFKNPDNPVENVSWNDCKAFIAKLNAIVRSAGLTFRLPTETEWEYACRAGSTGDYCRLADGTEITADTVGKVAWHDGNSEGTTHPVGQKVPNAYGLYDMHGNVWEWCEDFYKADDSRRVFRGGDWYNNCWNCTAGFRSCDPPGSRLKGVGFRLVVSQNVNR